MTSAWIDWIVTPALPGTPRASPTWLPLLPLSGTAPAWPLVNTQSPMARPAEQVLDRPVFALVLLPYTDHPGETAATPGEH
jgi:hypothetical protein